MIERYHKRTHQSTHYMNGPQLEIPPEIWFDILGHISGVPSHFTMLHRGQFRPWSDALTTSSFGALVDHNLACVKRLSSSARKLASVSRAWRELFLPLAVERLSLVQSRSIEQLIKRTQELETNAYFKRVKVFSLDLPLGNQGDTENRLRLASYVISKLAGITMCKVTCLSELSSDGQLSVLELIKILLSLHGTTLAQLHISFQQHFAILLPILAIQAPDLKILSFGHSQLPLRSLDTVPQLVFPSLYSLEVQPSILRAILASGVPLHPLPCLQHLYLRFEAGDWLGSLNDLCVPTVEILGFKCEDPQLTLRLAPRYRSSLKILVLPASSFASLLNTPNKYLPQLLDSCPRLCEFQVHDDGSKCDWTKLATVISCLVNPPPNLLIQLHCNLQWIDTYPLCVVAERLSGCSFVDVVCQTKQGTSINPYDAWIERPSDRIGIAL